MIPLILLSIQRAQCCISYFLYECLYYQQSFGLSLDIQIFLPSPLTFKYDYNHTSMEIFIRFLTLPDFTWKIHIINTVYQAYLGMWVLCRRQVLVWMHMWVLIYHTHVTLLTSRTIHQVWVGKCYYFLVKAKKKTPQYTVHSFINQALGNLNRLQTEPVFYGRIPVTFHSTAPP